MVAMFGQGFDSPRLHLNFIEVNFKKFASIYFNTLNKYFCYKNLDYLLYYFFLKTIARKTSNDSISSLI